MTQSTTTPHRATRHRWRVGPLEKGIPSLAAGIAAGIPVGFAIDLAAGFLVGWSVAALIYAVWALVFTWRLGPERTKHIARLEAPGRTFARILAIIGSSASLVAVGLVLVKAQSGGTGLKIAIAGICVISVVASWLIIQVDYMLRVAAEYYADPIGGIDFNQKEDPMYTDFAYLAFGIGVTYQVSDTNISTNKLRRLIIAQSLLGYLFGAVILATIINLVSGLGSGS